MIYEYIPKNFNPRFEIVSCFCKYDDKFLLLHRQDGKSQGDRWGLPAGKVEAGETYSRAIARELFEETGIKANHKDLVHFVKLYDRYSEYDFTADVFRINLNHLAPVKINPIEHKDFRWVSPSEALTINLVQDLDTVIRMFC